MAPVPKDSKDKPREESNTDESGMETFHNPNLDLFVAGETDSSDENNEDDVEMTSGYSLLPSEPGTYEEDSDSDFETETSMDLRFAGSDGDTNPAEGATAALDDSQSLDKAIDLATGHAEVEPSSSTFCALNGQNGPDTREKQSSGKTSSYLDIPSLPRNKEGHLWNEKRSGSKKLVLDKSQESAILKAMSGFQLPPESIPGWAKNIPEEQWRYQIKRRIASNEGDAKLDSLHRDESSTHPSHGSSSDVTDTGSAADSMWVANFPEQT